MTMPRISFSDRVDAAISFHAWRGDLPTNPTEIAMQDAERRGSDADPRKVFLDTLENAWKKD
jgi:hypothetical protein